MIALPQISAEDYQDFRRTLKADIPATYGEWLSLCSAWRDEWAESGTTDVSITPDQFRRYLYTSGRAVNLKTLLEFAKQCGQ